jgi:hypothetical protein
MTKDLSRAGRPSVLTETVVSKLEQAFAIGANDSQACSYAGISRQTFYANLKKDSEFRDKIEAQKEKLALKAKQELAKLIQGGDRTTILWYLERAERQKNNPDEMTKEFQLYESIREDEYNRLCEIRSFSLEEMDRVNEYARTIAEAAVLRRKLAIEGATLISDKTGGQYTNPAYTQLQSVLSRMDKIRDKLFSPVQGGLDEVKDIRDEFF